MKKSLLLGITGVTLLALTATTLYAQTATGTSLVDKMKAAVGDFTLGAVLNPGETGLKSAPIAGKKTGDILTAGEWNRVLELLGQGGGGGLQISFKKDYSKDGNSTVPTTEDIGSHDFCALTRYGEGNVSDSTAGYCKVEKGTNGIWTVSIQALNNNINCQVTCFTGGGGSGGGSGWVDVPRTGTENFDSSCFYRFKTQLTNKQYVGTAPYYYVNAVDPTKLTWQFGNFVPEETWYISASSKSVLSFNGSPYTATGSVTKIEKLCGGGASTGGGVEIVEGGIIKTSAKTISNWDLITLEGSWNSGGGDAAPTGGYIYKLNGQPKLSYVEASGISKDVTLTTTAQTVHNLSVRLSGDSVIIDPSSSNTLAYIVWKFGGGSSTGTSSSTGIGTPDYQSDWIDFGLAGNPVKKKFTHNLGTENYMIQMEGKGPGGDNNNCPSFIGADSSNSWLMNSGYWYYYDKTSNSVSVANYTNSLGRCSRYIRIKLWKHGAPTIAPASTVTNA